LQGFQTPPPSPLPLPLPLRGWGWGWGWGWGDHLEPLGVGVKPSDGMGSGVRYLREYHALDEINPRTLGTLVPSPHKKTDRFGFHPPSGGWDPLVIWAKKNLGDPFGLVQTSRGLGQVRCLFHVFFFLIWRRFGSRPWDVDIDGFVGKRISHVNIYRTLGRGRNGPATGHFFVG
jgi:hypothetical protein